MTRKFAIALIALFALSLLLLVVGCSRKVAPSTTTVVRDSIVERTVEKIVRVPGDSVRFTMLLDCDSLTQKPKPFDKVIKKGLSKVEVKVNKGGELKVNSDCDSLLKIRTSIIEKMRSETQKETVTVIEYKTYWFDKYLCRPVAVIVLLLCAGIAIGKYLKFNPLR